MMAKKYYPDWILRFYTVGLPTAYEEELVRNSNVELVRCIRFPSTSRMMLHRFLVVDDPKVRYSMIRDVDSRFMLRDLLAVNEWLSSPWPFHAMRDHPFHTVPIMGCSFGMKRQLINDNMLGETPGGGGTGTTMTSLVEQALQQHNGPRGIPGCCGEDQNFLQRFVWPKVRDVTISHDSTPGSCQRHGSKVCRDFELGPRSSGPPYYFVGAPFKDAGITVTDHHCTLSCNMTMKSLQ